MDVDIKVLDVLLRSMSPGHLLNRLRHTREIINSEADKRLFERFAVSCLQEYSLDEQQLIYRRLQTEAARLTQQKKWNIGQSYRIPSEGRDIPEFSLASLTLYDVLRMANRMLTQRGRTPLCRFEQILPWRDLFLLLGQDLFVCAFLAQEDLRSQWQRFDFTWPAIIRTDHVGLNHLLSQGIAENHQHLYGSSQTFSLSWCNLMSYPESHAYLGKEFELFYQPVMTRGADDGLLSTRDRVRFACLCRIHLFQWLKERPQRNIEKPANGIMPDQKQASFQDAWNWLYDFYPPIRIENELRYMRVFYGARVPQPNGGTDYLDYALEKSIFDAAPNACYRSLAGERHLLYCLFQAFLEEEMDERTKLLFYLYLVLKAQFRSELIQVNRQVGFHNFSNYQDRKSLLCNRSCYWAELYRMALNAPLREGAVTSLETRLTPKKDPNETKGRVVEVDTMKYYADLPFEEQQKTWCLSRLEQEKFEKAAYFYVFHFIKSPDTILKHPVPFLLQCRHHKIRQTVKEQATALAKALSRSPYLCQRVRGIDCASHEIGCPPEVFASAYRFLRNFRVSEYRKKSSVFATTEPSLSATYHAGEDFLDIAGALRTIDEAIRFLELRRGDRIGHALGLGVDPEVHYALKGGHIYLSKQERLDNLVWLLYRSRQLGTQMDAHIYGSLKKEAEILLLDIYGNAMEENGWTISLTEYDCVMQLHGDDPQCYRTMEYQPQLHHGAHFDDFLIQTSDPTVERYRRTKNLAGMYYYYHFGNREKIRGSEITEVEVDAAYRLLMRQVQNNMQRYMAEKGIIVECNPSSNVLIGSFQQYKLHPIFRFNNYLLERNESSRTSCAQMQVCINTDDLGVFDTSLEFEYALLHHSLAQIVREDGMPCYQEEDILRYLDNIRNMGHRAVFPKVETAKQTYTVREGRNLWWTSSKN